MNDEYLNSEIFLVFNVASVSYRDLNLQNYDVNSELIYYTTTCFLQVIFHSLYLVFLKLTSSY